VSILLEKRANIEAANKDGATALFVASQEVRHSEMCEDENRTCWNPIMSPFMVVSKH